MGEGQLANVKAVQRKMISVTHDIFIQVQDHSMKPKCEPECETGILHG